MEGEPLYTKEVQKMRTSCFIKLTSRAVCHVKGIFAATSHENKAFTPAAVSGMKGLPETGYLVLYLCGIGSFCDL